MQCTKCHFDNREGAKFCLECGGRLEFSCPQCGAVLPVEAKFCDRCGRNLKTPKTSPSVDSSQRHAYTPKHLAEKILTSQSAIEGELKLVTVLFADIANFTAMSEKLDPEEVHQVMDGCFQILMNEIHKFEGTINQFTGDGVMALFGAPVCHEDHAARACHAALNILERIEPYAGKIKMDYDFEFKLRIGLNSGPVMVGAIGDDLRMDYTAMGDTTNLAARLQGMAQPGTALGSKNIHHLVKDYFEFRPLGMVTVKGKEAAQEIYELVGPGDAATRIEVSAVKGLTRFVGRSNSLSILMEAWQKTCAGSGQVVDIVGEAGIGKSRLLVEFRNRLGLEKFTFLVGNCIHFGDTMAYLPLLEMLRAYLGLKEGDAKIEVQKRIHTIILNLDSALKPTLFPIEDLLSLKVEDEAYCRLEPMQKKERTFEALRDLFIRLSQTQPLILAVENLHWIDRTAEEFLEYLIEWLPGTRILLILLYRPEYAHSWGNKSYLNRIGLDQLDNKSSAELVRAVLEDGEVASEISDLVLKRAGGNPLFMEELTRSLLENGTIIRKDQRIILSSSTTGPKVPDTVQAIIAARIDRLEDNLKRIMQVASVIGRAFAFRILQAIVGMREELKANLLNLQGLEFIYEKSLFPELEYIFKHALTQEVAYDSLLVSHRKEIHEKIGTAIVALYPERLEEFYEMIAYHYGRADEPEKAYPYLKLAAEKAYARYANQEALQFFLSAVEACDRLSPADWVARERMEIRGALALPARALGYPQGSLKYLTEAVELAKELGQVNQALDYECQLATAYALKGQCHLAVEPLQRCYQHAEKSKDLDLMAKTARDLSTAYTITGAFKEIIEMTSKVIPELERANRLVDGFGRPGSTYAVLCADAGFAMGTLGRFQEGIALCEKRLQHTALDHFQEIHAYCELNLALILTIKGDGKSAIAHAQLALDLIQRSDTTIFRHLIWAALGHGCLLTGDPESGWKNAQKALEVQQQAQTPYHLAYIYWILASCHMESGRLEKAILEAEESLELARLHHERYNEGQSCMQLGWVQSHLQGADTSQVERLLNQALTIFNELGAEPSIAVAHLRLGHVHSRCGKRHEGAAHLKTAHTRFQKMHMDYWAGLTRRLLEAMPRHVE